jgi:2-polyprenyl-3-methyl-5-hydroxy-6-metoxy-1,4-benzoquinol methylase
MHALEHDKLAERDRYDRRARLLLADGDLLSLGPEGAASQPLPLRRPYTVFEQYIRCSVRPGDAALDICCGTGLFSLVAARAGAQATATGYCRAQP